MDKHVQELQLVCRRSGIRFSQLGSGSPVRISELSREAILAYFSIDISQDSKEVHPPSLCHRCAKVIRRYEAARQDLRFFEHSGGGCSDRCIEWLPHKRTGCTFCASSHRSSVGRPPKRRKSSAVLPPPATSEPLEFSPLQGDPDVMPAAALPSDETDMEEITLRAGPSNRADEPCQFQADPGKGQTSMSIAAGEKSAVSSQPSAVYPWIVLSDPLRRNLHVLCARVFMTGQLLLPAAMSTVLSVSSNGLI